MQRIPEPELMEDMDQAVAYANADFEEPHNRFIAEFRSRFPELKVTGHVLDLGCGPADIAIRFARAYPDCQIDGIDGAAAMLREGEKAVANAGLQDHIHLRKVVLSASKLPQNDYSVVISNSLLHHLHDPMVLWNTVRDACQPDTTIFIMDLMRPASDTDARKLVEEYAANEPEVLQRDFYNSLRAAFLPEEVEAQLKHAGMEGLSVAVISDRHFIAFGQCAPK